MTTMKQAWLMGKGGPWEVRDVPIPEPGPNEVLVKMTASSICNQTDLNAVRALHPVHDQMDFADLGQQLRHRPLGVPEGGGVGGGHHNDPVRGGHGQLEPITQPGRRVHKDIVKILPGFRHQLAKTLDVRLRQD